MNPGQTHSKSTPDTGKTEVLRGSPRTLLWTTPKSIKPEPVGRKNAMASTVSDTTPQRHVGNDAGPGKTGPVLRQTRRELLHEVPGNPVFPSVRSTRGVRRRVLPLGTGPSVAMGYSGARSLHPGIHNRVRRLHQLRPRRPHTSRQSTCCAKNSRPKRSGCGATLNRTASKTKRRRNATPESRTTG